MHKNLAVLPAAKTDKTGAISRPFLVVMLAGCVTLAGGYAVFSRSQNGGNGSQSGPQSGAFQPETSSESTSESAATPEAPAAKVETKNKEGAKAAVSGAKTTKAAAPATVKSAGQAAAAAKPEKSPKLLAKAAPAGESSKAAPAAKVSAPAAAPEKNQEKPRLAQASAAPRAGAAGEWPEYRGPARDGISRETGWFKEGAAQTVWQARIGTGFASPVIAQGRVYAMGNENNQDTVWCLNASDGKVLWKYSYACDLLANSHEGGPAATPVVNDGVVYTYSKRGHLNALDAATGRLLWKKDIANEMGGQVPGWGISSSPAVYGNSLFVMTGAPGACVSAFDKKTGTLQWKAGNDAPSYASLQIFNWQNTPYLAAFNASGIVFYGLKDGKELWRYGWKTAYDVNAAIPIIYEDKVFISSGYNTGAAMLQSSKKDALLWQNRNMRNHFNASVLVNGYLYGFDESELACLDAATGKPMWKQGRLGKGSLIAADGKLIILSERGELVIAEASPNGYKELSRSQVLGGKCWTSPSLAGGRIYARNAGGDLVCVKF